MTVPGFEAYWKTSLAAAWVPSDVSQTSYAVRMHSYIAHEWKILHVPLASQWFDAMLPELFNCPLRAY
jgi:hypothetical protein